MRLFYQLITMMVLGLMSLVSFGGEAGVRNPPPESATLLQATPAKPMLPLQKTNLNNATAQELLLVKGLNTSKVRAIIAFRKKHTSFKSLEELRQVKGMKRLKPNEMKEIQDQLKL